MVAWCVGSTSSERALVCARGPVLFYCAWACCALKQSLIIIMCTAVVRSAPCRPTLRYGLRSAYDLINLCACVRGPSRKCGRFCGVQPTNSAEVWPGTRKGFNKSGSTTLVWRIMYTRHAPHREMELYRRVQWNSHAMSRRRHCPRSTRRPQSQSTR